MVESSSSVGRLSLEVAKGQNLSGQELAALVSEVCLYSSIKVSWLELLFVWMKWRAETGVCVWVCVICGLGGSGELHCPANSLQTMAWKYMIALSI